MAGSANLTLDYLRLDTFLKKTGTRPLREIFRRRYSRAQNRAWEDGAGRCKEFLKVGGLKDWKPIQKGRILIGDLRVMDLPLVGQLLTMLKWVDRTPEITREEKIALEAENKLIQDLVDIRKTHAHMSWGMANTSIGLAQTKLNPLWESSKRVLLQLGGKKLTEEIRNARNSDLSGVTYGDAVLTEENMTKSHTLRHEGDKYAHSNEPEKAIECYTKALELQGLLDIERGKLYCSRSAGYLQMSRTLASNESKIMLEKAFEDVRLVEYRPEWWEGFFRGAEVYKAMNQLRPAVICCYNALKCKINEDETEIVKSLQNEILKLADEQGLHLDCSFDGPTEISLLYDLRKHAAKLGVPIPETESLSELVEKLLNSGNPHELGIGSVFKGHCYFYGLGGHMRNIEMGAKLYIKAAGKKNPYGIYYTALCHLTGEGAPQLADEAKSLMEIAADHTETAPIAMGALGKFHETDHGPEMPQDLPEAARWYARAAEAGNGEASHYLACLYNKGNGVQRDKNQAFAYWLKAAEQGYESATERLATEYLEDGYHEQAKRWFSRTIEAGCLTAFLNKRIFEEKLQAVKAST